MRKLKHRIRAYRRKWARMPQSDRIFVIKFLGVSLFILIAVIMLLIFIVRTVANNNTDKKSTSAKQTSASSAVRTASKDKTASEPGSTGEPDPAASFDPSDPLFDSAENNEEAALLSRLVNAEAGSASRETKIAVASVILNRVNSDIFPDTIYDVIYQEGQYPPATNGMLDQTPNEESVEAALYVYTNGSQIPSNVLYQSSAPQGSGVWAELDGQYFCYE